MAPFGIFTPCDLLLHALKCAFSAHGYKKMNRHKLLDILPSALFSRAFGAVADLRFPHPVQRLINRGFASMVGIRAQESMRAVESFESLGDLFVREIKPQTRPVADAQLVSPVDGKLSFCAKIQKGTLLQAKGQAYRVCDLVMPPRDMPWLDDAFAFTIYLAPRDYHRIHAPLSGCVTDMSYAPGRLLPVNRIGYCLADDLLPANERLTSFMENDAGRHAALVKVGATCVGKISVVYDDFMTNADASRKPFSKTISPPFAIRAADPLACFHLGSTVVLLVSSAGFVVNPELKLGMAVQFGQALGNWN